MAWAVVTGASSGIGKDIAKELSQRGYNLVLVARRGDRLEELRTMLKTNAEIITMDLSIPENCHSLFDRCKNKDVEILVNNAGIGHFGEFYDTDLDTELRMIDLNIKSLHILMKLFLQEFVKKDCGKILNVASAAGFLPAGPFISTYYGTKAYVLNHTRGVAKELKKSGSNVTISALCPGPVKTEFNEVAGGQFAMVGMECDKVAAIAVAEMFKGKTVIVPGAIVKIGRFLSRFLPDSALAAVAYRFQGLKKNSKEEHHNDTNR